MDKVTLVVNKIESLKQPHTYFTDDYLTSELGRLLILDKQIK